MANDPYTTLAKLKHAVNIDASDTSEDAALTTSLTAACRQIDGTTHRRFWIDDAPVARTFRLDKRSLWTPDGHLLMVPDIATAVGLVVEVGAALGGTWSPVTAYELDPENALTDGKPATGLLHAASWGIGPGRRVRVTAKWGWPAVPAAVEEAARILAARLFRRKDSPEGVLGSAEWGTVRISRADHDVQNLIQDLIAPEGIG